jgi:hypothetical protein
MRYLIQKKPLGKSDDTYRITIKNMRNNKKGRFIYQDSCPEFTRDDNILFWVLQDAITYDCYQDVKDFIEVCGYEDNVKDGKRCYKNCKKAFKMLHKIFNDKEIKEIKNKCIKQVLL